LEHQIYNHRGDDNNDHDDADDEQLLVTGGDKNADAFATIFTEQLTK